MRDGTELLTDLYLPTPQAKGLPCILLRSPAGRQSPWNEFVHFAKEGYVVAIQETRSATDPEGKTFPFLTDAWGKSKDGYDTVEWLAKSPYTNGNIGTWGSSALGIIQMLMAPTNPPHLKCQYIIFGASSLYHHAIFPGGQLLKDQVEGWLGHYAKDPGVLNFVCHRPFYNEFWKQFNALEFAKDIHVPSIHIAGWFDTFLRGTVDSFVSRQYDGGEGAKGKQKLVIGPWTHYWPHSLKLGDFNVPKNAIVPPFDISSKRWFDFYLKGIKNGADELPPVIYYVMGPFDGSPSKGNVWRTSEIWPVPAKQMPFFLGSNFTLTVKKPANGSAAFHYDPLNMTPTIGGCNLFLESGPKDQRTVESRSDSLSFTTAPLNEDLEVTGPISAHLYFKTDQKDTDLVLKLCDVYPDGRSILISEGGYRLQTSQPHLIQDEMDTEKVIEMKIDLAPTSMVFAKGHALRFSISSSNYPRLERNHNVGILSSNVGKSYAAHNQILTGEKFPSRLVLPIISQ